MSFGVAFYDLRGVLFAATFTSQVDYMYLYIYMGQSEKICGDSQGDGKISNPHSELPSFITFFS